MKPAQAEFDLFDTPPEPRFDRFVELICAAIETPVSIISLVGPDRQFFKAARGLPEPWASLRETPLSHSFCQHVVAMERTLIVEDAILHPLVANNLAICDLGVIAYLGEPIRRDTGAIVGAVCAIDTKRRAWTERDLCILRIVADMINSEIACLPHGPDVTSELPRKDTEPVAEIGAAKPMPV